MIKNSKFVKTAIAVAALGLAAMASQAAITATPTLYAQEIFLGSAPATTPVSTPVITIIAPTAIAAGSILTVVVKLTGATWVGAATSATPGGANGPSAATTYNSNSAATLDSTQTATGNADSAWFTVTAAALIPIGGTVATIARSNIQAAGLATLGSTVTATSTMYVGALTASPVFGTAITLPVNEATSTAVTVATVAKAVNYTASAGTTSQKVVLPTQKTFSTTAASSSDSGAATVARIGNVGLTAQTNVPQDATGVANYAAVGTGGAGVATTLTLTAAAGYFAAIAAPTGGVAGSVDLRVRAAAATTACSGAALGAFTITAPATATTATLTATIPALAATVPFDICYTPSTTTVNNLALTAATLTGTSGTATATNSVSTVSSTVMTAFSLNGASKTTSAYWPGAWASSGYTGYTRVTNTGTQSALLTFAYVNPTTGVTSATFTLPTVANTGLTNGVLPAGASAMIANTTIETAGVAAGVTFVSATGRLLITAPTESMSVQNYVQTSGAAPQETSAAN